MASRSEVENFLMEFHQKMKVFQIRFRDDREKNFRALLDLEITQTFRIKIIESLSAHDYVEGPAEDTLNAGAPLWVFGSEIKKRKVYIKISIGPPNRQVICISFHEAEFELIYPYK